MLTDAVPLEAGMVPIEVVAPIAVVPAGVVVGEPDVVDEDGFDSVPP